MATIFTGMSKDTFLDKLVEKTGKNGKELYDYLLELIPEAKKETDSSAWEPLREFGSFYGNNAAALNYLISLGADESTQKLFKASSPEFRAAILAATARVMRFEWTAPVHMLGSNDHWEDRTYIGYWNGDTKHYDF